MGFPSFDDWMRGGNGQQTIMPVPEIGESPWLSGINAAQSQMQTDQGAVPGQIQAAQSTLTGLQGQQASEYPSFPNQAGIGSQTGYQEAQPPQQAPQTGPSATNPWAFTGPALSR